MGTTVFRNVLSNWIGTIFNVLVGFFMMPFVIHALGTHTYGSWVLLQSLISYMFLLDFGVRSSLNRYLAKFLSEGASDQIDRVFNTGLAVYLLVAGTVLCLSCATALLIPNFFSFPTIGPATIFWTTIALGAFVALRFPIAVFDALLTGLLRYDLMNISQIVSLLVRTVLIIVALTEGYGVLGLSLVTLFSGLLNLAMSYVFAIWCYPHLTVSLVLSNIQTLRLLANHSVYAYILLAATRVITDAGIIVTGLVVGETAVALYAVAAMLTSYATNVISGISTIVPPMASSLEVKGDTEGLRALCIRGTKFILLVGMPILLTFIITGEDFLKLWIGEEFAASYGPLVLLSLSWAFNFGQAAAACILMGLSRHRVAAWLVLIQSLLNLTLSSILGYQNGLLGVAWGAFIASAVMNTIFQAHALRLLDVSYKRFVLETLVPTAFSLIPFVAVLLMLCVSTPPRNLFVYFLQVGIALSAMLTILPWSGLTRQERTIVWDNLNRWGQAARLLPS